VEVDLVLALVLEVAMEREVVLGRVLAMVLEVALGPALAMVRVLVMELEQATEQEVVTEHGMFIHPIFQN
jgi:hypothetical protein